MVAITQGEVTLVIIPPGLAPHRIIGVLHPKPKGGVDK